MTKKIAVYGSLRKGEYNYERFLKYFPNQIEVLGTERLPYFSLYDLGSYPGIKKTNNPQDTVVFDILKVSDSCYNALYLMEIGANYKTIDINVNNEEQVIAFEYLGKVYEDRLVKSGDWSDFLKSNRVYHHESEITT